MNSSTPLPPDDLQSEDGGSSFWITLLAALSGVVAGWAAIRGMRQIQSNNAASHVDPALSAQTKAHVSFAGKPPSSTVDIPPISSDSVATYGRVPPQEAIAGLSEGDIPARFMGRRFDTVWARPTKYLVAIGLILFGFLALYLIRDILPIFIIAGLIALIVQPLIEWFQTRVHLPRKFSMALAYGVILLLVMTIPLIVIPMIWNAAQEFQTVEATSVYARAGDSLNSVQQMVASIPLLGPAVSQSLRPLQTMFESAAVGDPVSILPSNTTIADTSRIALTTFGRVTGAIIPLISWVLAAAFAFLISVYLSSGRYSLRAFILDNTPTAYVPEISILLDRIGWTWESFLRGQIKLMVLIGVVVMVGNFALGNRYAIMLGLISGLLELIPSIGPAIALVPGILIALIFGSAWLGVNHLLFAIIILVFYLLVQAAENQLVVPRVLGDAVELPPLVVLVGVLVGGSLAGILGALIAVPVIGTVREIVGYLYGKIIEAPIIEAPPELKPGVFQSLAIAARDLRARVFKTNS